MHGHAARAIFWRENALHLAAFACRVEDLLDGAGNHALALHVVALAAQHRVRLSASGLTVSEYSDLSRE